MMFLAPKHLVEVHEDPAETESDGARLSYRMELGTCSHAIFAVAALL